MHQPSRSDRSVWSRRWAAPAAAGVAAAVTLLVLSTFGDETAAAYAEPAAGHRVPTATPSATVTGPPTSPRPASSGPTTAATTGAGTSTATTQPHITTSAAGAPTPRRTSSHGGAGPYGRPSSTTPAAVGGTADEAAPDAGVPDWTSYLPTPQTGMKIFLAGLIGLAAAISGLATLALRRREY